MSTPHLSIVIVSYNTKDMTLDCLRSVYEETDNLEYEVIVYDNASKDGSAEAIAEQFPQVRLIAAKENIGFAMGNNKAIEQANGKFILLLNPDTVVLDNAINKIIDFAESNPDFGIWGGKTLFGDRTLNPNSCFAKMSVWNQLCRATGLAAIFKNSGIFNGEHYGGWKRNSVRHVDIVCGCFLLIQLELWKRLNGFSKKYFMYAEEADLCLRAKKLGFNPAVTPDAVIVHYGGGSEKIRADKMVRLLAAKSELLHEHWPGIKKPVGRQLLKAWVLSRFTAHYFMSLLPWYQSGETLATWREIWQRSGEWVNGYSGRKSE